jgi:oligopeptide transport system permease protein
MSAQNKVISRELEFPEDYFHKGHKTGIGSMVVRPSLSYWQDALRRFRSNKQSLFAFVLANLLMAFSFIGPFLWTKDPAQQELNSPSLSPTLGQPAIVVGEPPQFEPEIVSDEVINQMAALVKSSPLGKVEGLTTLGAPTTQRVVIKWDYLPGTQGYSIYRNEVAPTPESLGVPMGDISQGSQVSFEDTQSLEARDYYYAIVAKEENGEEAKIPATLKVSVMSAIDVDSAKALGVKSSIGSKVRLSASPLGTDSLGRDILSRLMTGGRVSLFIGLLASVLTVLFGIALGGVAGFFGGTIDTVLMRFTDLITGLPFLLFMILLKVVLNVGPGESGVTALLISLVILSWTGTARLVRGQILQLRNSEFVQAARLMGARPGYLILRHMLPNLIGVILVTLTFQIPSAIFTEAFLSFIGLGVAAPATSWGSMCNDGIQSLLTRPYEFFAPAVVISLTVLSFNLLGDGLRDALDPKLRSNE